MERKLRIAFVWDWDSEDSQTFTWRDGLYAALIELEKRGHVVLVLTCGNSYRQLRLPGLIVNVTPDMRRSVKEFSPDVILHWADMTRPNASVGRELGIKQAICFAGGNPYGDTLKNFDLVFVESEVYKKKFLDANVPVLTAFGTNTRHYDPNHLFVKDQPKVFDVCFPATYAQWKRHKKFADAVRGLKAVACGYMYSDHETDCWKDCQAAGVLTLPHVSADVLRSIYASSLVCAITSDSSGGSQRTVLEAMAMNVPLVVTGDSDKCSEYMLDAMHEKFVVGNVVSPDGAVGASIRDWLSGGMPKVNSREYILSKWSEFHYADAIEKGLYAIC